MRGTSLKSGTLVSEALEKRGYEFCHDADTHLVDTLRCEARCCVCVLHSAGEDGAVPTALWVPQIRLCGLRPASCGQPGTKLTCRLLCAEPGQRRSPRSFGLLRLSSTLLKTWAQQLLLILARAPWWRRRFPSSGQTCSRWLCYGSFLRQLTNPGQHFSAHLVFDDSVIIQRWVDGAKGKRYCAL